MHGNDFQSWRNATTMHWCRPLRAGSGVSDSNHIHTVELNYLTSGSWKTHHGHLLLNSMRHTPTFPTYAQVLTEYNRSDFKPVFMVEANYEFEHNLTPMAVRRKICDTRNTGQCSVALRDKSTEALTRGGLRSHGGRI